MFVSFQVLMPTYANKLGSIEDAKQFCLEFVSRMID